MSSKMLGVDDGNGAIGEIDQCGVTKSPDKKKSLPSTASKNIKNSSSQNDIKKFFLASPPEKAGGTAKQSNQNNVDINEYTLIEDCQSITTLDVPVNQDKNSAKKSKPKWSLAWKVSKKSKYSVKSESDSDLEELTEISSDKIEEFHSRKTNEKKKNKIKGENEKDNTKLRKSEKKNASWEDSPDELQIVESHDIISSQKNDLGIGINKATSEMMKLGSEKELKSNDKANANNPIKTPNLEKKKKRDNAFEILMSKKSPSTDKEEQLLVSNQCTNEKIEDDILCHDEPSSVNNAFDVLMTKKKASNNDVNSKSQSPKKSRPKKKLFALNIHYSKTQVISGSDDEVESSTVISRQTKDHESAKSKKEKKISKRKKYENKGFESEKETHNTASVTTVASGENTSKIQTKSKKSSIKEKKVYKPEIELPEEVEQTIDGIRMTKVKRKKKRKSSEPVMIQEDNEEEDVKTKNKHGSQDPLISPGMDDFDVPKTRTGLRKRTPKINNDASVLELSDSKRKMKEKKKKKEKEIKENEKVNESIAVPDSPEVEVAKSCKVTERVPVLATQKLASIFVKQKPKEKPKNDSKTTKEIKEKTSDSNLMKEIIEVSSAESKQDKPAEASKPVLNDEELKAVNTAFIALFSSCKTVKVQSTVVQGNQQPAPWPLVSHITQCNEQANYNLRNLNEFSLKMNELAPDETQKQILELKLGDFTSSLSKCKVLERNKKSVSHIEYESLSPLIIKKFISEVTSSFPGVPLRRLYKQYKDKQGLSQLETTTALETKLVCKDTKKNKKGKNSFLKDEDIPVQEKMKTKQGCSKRKASTQSEDELSEKQIKKMRRKKERENKITDDKNETIVKASESKQTRRKRSRDQEENCEDDKVMKRSTRSSKHSQVFITEEEQNEKEMKSSKRKKRKTMEDELEVHEVTKDVNVKSEDSRASNVDKKDLLWTERYQPDCSSEVIGNASAVTRLKAWLEAWKIKREKTLRREIQLQKRLLAKQKKNSEKKSASLEWWEEDHDTDFHCSDEDSDDSGNEDSGLSSAMLVAGPRGSGKTATVYACAKELGYKVFEVNCSSKRSSKQIMSRLEEATQSHLVISDPSTNIPKSSAFGGLFANMTKTTSPFQNLIKKDSDDADKKKSQSKEKGKLKKKEQKEKQTDVSTEGDSNSHLKSLKVVSLILFEEVDLVMAEDKGFWSAVTSFINNAKCPIIMTSNNSGVDCEGRFDQLILKMPSVNLLSAHLQLTALVNNVLVHPDEVKTLVSLYKCDIRKCLLALQFWILSGGGKKMKWKKFLKKKGQNEKKEEPGNQKSQNRSKPEDQVMAVLDNPDEESLFLTVVDWKTLAKRHTRGSARGQTTELEESDSNQETPNRYNPTVDENTHTDSIVDIVESNESQSVPVPEDDNTTVTMPGVHYLLVEHVLGLLNSTLGFRHGWRDLLKERTDLNECLTNKYNLTQYSQSLGVNLVQSNLPTLLPVLHTRLSVGQESESIIKTTKMEGKNSEVQNMVSDRDVFDDGRDSKPDDSRSCRHDETTVATTPHDTKEWSKTTQKFASKEKRINRELHKKALDIFATLAEDMSFMDAHTQGKDNSIYQSVECGWWRTRETPGLSDNFISINRTCDWHTQDTSACIRGALEISSLECSYVKCKSLSNSSGNCDGLLTELENYLPAKPQTSMVKLSGVTDNQLSRMSSMNKLYKNVNSSLPLIVSCSHGAVCADYLPTLRSICHSERVREIANTKRRFLHYMGSASMSTSTMLNLANAFLVP